MKITRRIFICLIFVLTIVVGFGCKGKSNKSTRQTIEFKFPKSKIWAHRANDTLVAQIKKELFAGLEVDIWYSEYQDKIFVAHDLEDTLKNITLEQWFASLDNPNDCYYWIDAKNLSVGKAVDVIPSTVVSLLKRFKIDTNKVLIEHMSYKSLMRVKEYGLNVLLWSDWFKGSNAEDTLLWIEDTKRKIAELNPVAISCSQRSHPTWTNAFPEMNILYWNTNMSIGYEKNLALAEELINIPNVKVVLVRYDEPPKFEKTKNNTN